MATKVIYKYSIPILDYFTVSMPAGAVVLTVQLQRGQSQIWALVDPAASPATYRFRLAGTGHPIDEAETMKYIGTVQPLDGAFVVHLFQIEENHDPDERAG